MLDLGVYLKCWPSNHLRSKNLAYILIKMHRGLQPNLLEKYHLEVPFFQGRRFAPGCCSVFIQFCPLWQEPQLPGCTEAEAWRVPPPTQCDPRRSHGAARRSWVCSSHADTSGAGTAGERRHPPKVTSSCSSHLVPVDLAFHLFFTNFFLEALGFNRLLPAPKVLSRICRVADRLEMSFSAKGDTPAT